MAETTGHTWHGHSLAHMDRGQSEREIVNQI